MLSDPRKRPVLQQWPLFAEVTMPSAKGSWEYCLSQAFWMFTWPFCRVRCHCSTRPPLAVGGYSSGFYSTHSLSWHLPQGHVSSIPGGARLLCAGPCFFVPSLPNSSPDQWAKSFEKWDFSLYYQTGAENQNTKKWRMRDRRGQLASCV